MASDPKNPFEMIPHADTRADAIRALQVRLQAELLRAGAQWDESLAILRELITHRSPVSSGPAALTWYRSTYPPKD